MYKNKIVLSHIMKRFNKIIIQQFLNRNDFFEIILLIINSTDKISEESKRFPQFMLKKLSGIGAAIRKGMSVSQSDFIVMCEPKQILSG